MPEPYNIKIKVCLIGDSAVGKTSVIRRYVMDIFEDKYLSTLGTKVSKKRVIVKRGDEEIDLTFSIWDVLGQENFKNIHSMAFKGSKGAIIVCDITRKETLENIVNWKNKLIQTTGDIPFIIIANKCDLTDKYSITEQDLQEFSSKLNAPYFKTSAKFGDNIIKSFYILGEIITNEIFEKKLFG